ncbi:hypothetical protein NQ317_019928 [Molorchus minor]|uniref:WW domain-containing protein n=1 Tax=Molorchus minor TaxID=1323400 RepID=A0ABQ9K594_9CUCU|nr:hypothetical protein NQ317_019928 [Molorchus minor]
MEEPQGLPSGWTCSVNSRGKHYFTNQHTGMTTTKDPRTPCRHLQGGINAKQDISSEYIQLQISPIPAFQMPAHMSPKRNPLQDLKPRMSPLSVKSPKVQESSLTLPTDTDEAVAKIFAMFPTVSENHIKLLLKKYMKAIFPEADETLILEFLQNNDNKIQMASDLLKEMGFTKKDTVKVAQQKMEAKQEEKKKEEDQKLAKQPSPQVKIKSAEEKMKMKAELQNKYIDVAEHLITIALESVNFNEARANQILQIMIQEDTQQDNEKNKEEKTQVEENGSVPSTSASLPISQSRQSLKVIEEHGGQVNHSTNLTSTKGPDPVNVKGTNKKLLLEDYINWQGRDMTMGKGPQNLAKGPNPNILSIRSYQPCGPNSQLRKGPKFGLAKGSIFSHIKTVIVGESHGE